MPVADESKTGGLPPGGPKKKGKKTILASDEPDLSLQLDKEDVAW
jgi:hypothetical protein